MFAVLSAATSGFHTVSREQTSGRRPSGCITMAKEEHRCWTFLSDLSFPLCGQKQTVASVGTGYDGGGGNKGGILLISTDVSVFSFLTALILRTSFVKRTSFFSHTLGDSRCILYDARSDDDRTPFLFLFLFLRNTAEEPERRRNNTEASRRAASDSKWILRVSGVSQFGGDAANDSNGSEESFRI